MLSVLCFKTGTVHRPSAVLLSHSHTNVFSSPRTAPGLEVRRKKTHRFCLHSFPPSLSSVELEAFPLSKKRALVSAPAEPYYRPCPHAVSCLALDCPPLATATLRKGLSTTPLTEHTAQFQHAELSRAFPTTEEYAVLTARALPVSTHSGHAKR